MITEEQILLYLHNDKWFSPSQLPLKAKIKNESGEIIEVAQSYYHSFKSGEQISIRVSNHGTSLQTWVRRYYLPKDSLQNLSVVFSNELVSSKLQLAPVRKFGKDGKETKEETYFVIEQYVYKMDSLSFNDFKKIINKIKSLSSETVFNDPFKKKPTKRANRMVLTPTDYDGNKIPSSTNTVNKRQTIVANNPNKEVGAKGEIIDNKKHKRMRHTVTLTEVDLHRIIKECISEALDEVSLGGETLHGNNPADWMTMSSVRSHKACFSKDGNTYKHRQHSEKDMRNMCDVADDMKEKCTFDTEIMGGSMDKARRIDHNLNRNPLKKYVSDKLNQFKNRNETVNHTTINEDFSHWKSQKLAELIKQHGYPKYRDKATNYLLTQLTDEDVSDNVVKKFSTDRYIELGDGSCVDLSNSAKNEVANDYFCGWSGNYDSKYIPKMRPNNGFAMARANNDVPVDYYARKHYKPMTTRGEDANSLRNNPYFRNDKDKTFNKDSGWNRKEADRVMNNLRKGNDMHDNPNRKIK